MILYFLVTLPTTSGKLRFSFHFDRFLDHFFWIRPMNISLMTWKFWKLKSFFTRWKIKCHKRPLEGDETQMRGWVNKLKTKGLNCCSDPSITANARITRSRLEISWRELRLTKYRAKTHLFQINCSNGFSLEKSEPLHWKL